MIFGWHRFLVDCAGVFNLSCLLLLASALTGCSVQDGSKSAVDAALVKRVMVADCREDVQSIEASYAGFQEDHEITLAGRIYAEGMSPFDPKESVFSIIELPKPGHNHEDPGDCPFCLHDLRNAKIAIVRVVTAEGSAYAKPADQLLGLKKNQDVVITGRSSKIGDTLVLELRQLHLLSPNTSTDLAKRFRQSKEAS